MEQLQIALKESYNELINKVTWPTWSSLINTTIVVSVASVILSLIIFIMDAISKGVLNNLIYGVNG